MRPFLAAVLLLFSLCLPAAGQTALAAHQASPPSTAAVNPIIPGSPLAALTGATPADSDADTPAPFGTQGIGLSVSSAIAGETGKTLDDFLAAIRHATALQPVAVWLRSFTTDATRQAHLKEILTALFVTVLPGWGVEAALRLALARPRAAIANRAVPRPGSAAAPEEAEQGLGAAEAGETEKRPSRRVPMIAWLRRSGFELLNLGLLLVPLLGFALTIEAIISLGYVSDRPARLAVVGITNAYLANRIVVEFARLLVAPAAPGLRLIRMPTHRAVAVMRAVDLLLATGLAGFAAVSVAEVLGLAHEAALPVIRLVALVLHIEVAILIWRSRRLVGAWLGGNPNADSSWARTRRRLGALWYIPALFYVMALWIALAAGIHNAFGVLLRIILVVATALVLGRLAWAGTTALLERVFPDPATVTARHPALYARARAYNPLIRLLVRVIIGVLMLVLTLQGWGLDAFGWLLNDPLSRSLIGALISVIITIAATLLIWEVINAYIHGRVESLTARGKTRQASRLRTLLPILKATIGVLLTLVAFYICMTKIGVNAAPLFASFGVLSIAVAFGSQKLVQDIITGLFLLLEDAMQVGDVVSLAGMSGTVERLSIRTIRLRGGDGSINIIPFSAVTTVTNMTRDFGYAEISIHIGYHENLDRVSAILRDIAKTMRAEPAWGAMMRDDLQLNGLDEFAPNALVITGQIRTGPGQHWSVRREFYARVQRRFASEGIEIPHTPQRLTIEQAPCPKP